MANADNSEPRINTRQYIFSEAQTRLFFILSGVGMVAVVVTLLILASAKPQGAFKELDRTNYIETLESATTSISEYRENADGTVSIPIERAMELVAERGTANPFEASSATPEGEAAPETDTPDAAPAETAPDAEATPEAAPEETTPEEAAPAEAE